MKLINLSGGIDSAHCAWDYLRRGEKIILHHCNMTTPFKRLEHETRAVKNILNYFQKNKFTFLFIETGIDLGYPPKGAVRDLEVIWMMCGFLARRFPFETIVACGNKEDYEEQNMIPSPFHPHHTLREREEQTFKLIERFAFRSLKKEAPFQQMSKKDIILRMPEDLLKLTWSCRMPRRGEPCGRCTACKLLRRVLWY